MLEQIFMSLCKIHSPPRGEHTMIAHIKNFFEQRHISFQCDLQWGVYASLPSKKPSTSRDVLLMAHLDSTHTTIESCSSIQYNDQTKIFSFHPEIGLDDKTGLAVILEIVELYVEKKISVDFDIHILFSTKEEIGQQGLLNAPLKDLFDVKKLRYALCIDRKTNRNFENKRHIVDEYCSIALMENNEMLQVLNQAAQSVSLPMLTRQKSHNCADALELRIRLNLECFFEPQSEEQRLLYEQYNHITEQIREKVFKNESIGFFRYGPRAERYDIANQIISHMPNTGICIANISLDYDESRGNFDAQELKNTVVLLQQMLIQHNILIQQNQI